MRKFLSVTAGLFAFLLLLSCTPAVTADASEVSYSADEYTCSTSAEATAETAETHIAVDSGEYRAVETNLTDPMAATESTEATSAESVTPPCASYPTEFQDPSYSVVDQTDPPLAFPTEPTELPTSPHTPSPQLVPPAVITPNNEAKTKLTLKKSSASIYVQGSCKIKAKVKNGKGKTSFISRNLKVAKVSSSGKITGVSKGTAIIVVKNNDARRIFTIKVKNPRLNKTALTLKKGSAFKLKITGQRGKLSFYSKKPKIAKVSKSGKITALKKGRTTIRVKTNGMILKCRVRVTKRE